MARSVHAHHRWSVEQCCSSYQNDHVSMDFRSLRFVTGTPFHRSINDLEGIVQYLFPLTSVPREQLGLLLRNRDKIQHVFLSWLMNFLQLISRRTSRQCLTDLPEQKGQPLIVDIDAFVVRHIACSTIVERILRLQFSALERMYYERIWRECCEDFKQEFERVWQRHRRNRPSTLKTRTRRSYRTCSIDDNFA
jgi:hypothetical protein